MNDIDPHQQSAEQMHRPKADAQLNHAPGLKDDGSLERPESRSLQKTLSVGKRAVRRTKSHR